MKIGIVFPTMPHEISDVREYARWASERPGVTLWMGHSTVLDASTVASFLAGSGIRVPFGFAVALAPMLHPMHAAAVARSVSMLTGRSVKFGVGISSQGFVTAAEGKPYRRPGTRIAEYLDVMKAALSGEQFRYDGRELVVSGSIHHASSPDIEVGAGVLRPALAERVSSSADFIVTWLCPPTYIASALVPAVRGPGKPAEGARVIAAVQFSLASRIADPVPAMAEINGAHLRSAHYRDMLLRAGAEFGPADDVLHVASEAVAVGAALHGSPEELAARLRDMFDSGVDEIVLNPVSSYLEHGARAALADTQLVLDALSNAVSSSPG